ncbi:TetR/AcrR family transcriptional regulator [Kribbella sp. NPDC051587]|uniref:TetR/AcrR family transcriptional regulator n=1 Tax=Kribbella sp. NPDC051587 TaxID=3364119 RepID=UPI0037A801E9
MRGQGAAYDERRTAIVEAVLDLVDTSGVDQVTVRRVADRAGVSLGRVQHYFSTKDELLGAAFAAINELGARRVQERAGGDDVLRAVLLVLIPRTEEDRRLVRIQQAFETYALTSPELGAQVTQGYSDLAGLFALLLGGELADGHELLATAVGLSTLVLTDAVTSAQAERIIDARLRHIVGAAGQVEA